MKRRCSECSIIIQTGEKVAFEVEAIYREVPSLLALAVQKGRVTFDSRTLRHAACPAQKQED